MLRLSDCLHNSADWSAVELREQVGVGGAKERGRAERRDAKKLKLFVFGAQEPFHCHQSALTEKLHCVCMQEVPADSEQRSTGNSRTFIQSNSYDLSFTVVDSCFGFVYTFCAIDFFKPPYFG